MIGSVPIEADATQPPVAAPATPGLTFAVPDLHGRADLLDEALAAMAAYPAAALGRTVVFLGDYIDRGPASSGVIERLRAGPPDGWRWICLRGNHEVMMSLALRHPDQLDWWMGNGGDATVESYRGGQDRIAGDLGWIDALPTLHVDAHRVFVHGGVDAAVPLDRQADRTLLWKRYPRGVDVGHGTRHVVHGHDPDPDGPLRLANRTALDTLAWHTGRLVVGVFDDARAGGPVDLLEIRRRPAG